MKPYCLKQGVNHPSVLHLQRSYRSSRIIAMSSTPWSKLRHDLRTPVNAIIGYSELLLEDQEDAGEATGIAELAEIRIAGQQLLTTIDRILGAEQEMDSANGLQAAIADFRQATRSPLHSVLGYCQLLIEQNNPELQADLQKIQTATLQMREMLTRLETGELTLQTEEQPNASLYETTSQRQQQNHLSFDNQGLILVVDDHASNRDLLTQQLIRQHYRVDTAIDGRQALEKVAKGSYDLILLDIIMPEIDGYEVLRKLKANPHWKRIPVIMISALDEMETVVQCIEQGAADYLPKPFNPVLLRARIGACLEQKRLRDQETVYLNQITELNEKLKKENLRLGAELEVARQLQQMVLPKTEEIKAIKGLDIAAYMEPADEVGGDYYDVLYIDGVVTLGIGDVTGHGLESGVLMLMTQTAVLTLREIREQNPVRFLNTLNSILYKNIQRMDSERSLTLAILNYFEGKVRISGQHEEILIVRHNGSLERIDTIDLGIPIGLDTDISHFINDVQFELGSGEGVVLYTDGITEAHNSAKEQYGLDRLCEAISQNWQGTAEEINTAVIDDLRYFLKDQKAFDDITLLVLKQEE